MKGATGTARMPRVFVSYHHEDELEPGPYQGRVTQFATFLRRAIQQRTIIDYDPVLIDYEHKVTDQAWRQKIEDELGQTALFVAIMTSGYLRSSTCQWEWSVYRKLYLSHDHPRGFLTVKLCLEKIIGEELAKPAWSCARDQWEFPQATCEQAFMYGPTPQDRAWPELISSVRDEALHWIQGELVAVSGLEFSAQPRASGVREQRQAVEW